VNDDHPVRFSVEYPDRPLDRLSTAFRIFTVIPIAIVIGTIGGYTGGGGYEGGDAPTIAIGGTGLLFLPPLLMILFREKYPRWWYDWNLELLRAAHNQNLYRAVRNCAPHPGHEFVTGANGNTVELDDYVAFLDSRESCWSIGVHSV